jgi:ATP-dependent RNA helicase DDX55/SPB4
VRQRLDRFSLFAWIHAIVDLIWSGAPHFSISSRLTLATNHPHNKKNANMSADLKNKKKKSDPQSGGVVAATQVQAVPNSFEAFQNPHPLSPGVLDYVKSKGFTTMTPVQSATLPQFLAHKDVAVQAVTGSGKTLAFLIPMIEMLHRRKQQLRPHQIGGLVLSPTRELAQQTHLVATELCGACRDLRPPLLLVGGGSAASSASSNRRPVTADLELFRTTKADLIIGCPGRVNDVLSRYDVMDCTELECLVLDEADVLLNMGFSTTLQEILGRLPKMRRTALFSATQASSTTSSLNEWMHRMGMRNPMWIDVKVVASSSSSLPLQQQDQLQQSQATPTSLTNHYHVTQIDEKMDRLACFLRHHKEERFIVFFLTCACVDFFGHAFQQIFAHDEDDASPPFAIELLHGKMVQKRREKTMERFRQATGGAALFCTDVAARGLDVDNITWVVQVDAPQDPAVFIHRAGRAARAGKAGQSVIFLSPKEESYVDLLRMRNVPLQEMDGTAFTTKRGNTTPPLDDVPTVKDPSPGVISANDTVSILPMIRNLVLQDRDVLEKGTRAYTSYIRAYKEHQCAFIFR